MSDMTTSATLAPKRRWFRYSLRTFFVIITVLCLWLGAKLNAARQQQRAVEAVRGLGGNVKYDFEDGRISPLLEPPWLMTLLGPDFFHDVVSITIDGGRNGHEDFGRILPQLRQLPRLRFLELNSGTLRDDDLQYLSELKDLDYLHLLANNQIDGGGFKRLANLTTLGKLFVNGNPISDHGLESIAVLPNITSLGLNGTKVTDACIELLAKMPKLFYLNVSGSNISANGVRHLKDLRPDLVIDCSSDQKPSDSGR
jgi:hypothetical protein